MSKSVTKSIGILTAGGDCPGLNAAIRGIGKGAIGRYGMQVIGISSGYDGLINNHTRILSAEDFSGIQDYLYDFGDGSVTEWTNSSSATRGYAIAGPYTITVRVRDRSGLLTVYQPLTVNVRLPPRPPPTSSSFSIATFFSHIPVYVYYLITVTILAAMAGAMAALVMKKKRRAQLYIEVEKAEKERERRHTVEIHEDDPLGLPSVAAHRNLPGASAFTDHSGQGPSDGAPALVDWTPSYSHIDSVPHAQTFAPSQKRQPAAARKGSSAKEPAGACGPPSDDRDIQNILKRIEEVKGRH